jgi:3-(3-hydroxy-phenyl)propionate hydroxylase
MINLQQYHVEEAMVAACGRSPLVDLRWKHKLLSLAQAGDVATLTVETPDGVFQLQADWVIACDGANSDTRRMVDGQFTGQFFQDRFLIADVVMDASFPTERWFWFDPPFHRGAVRPDGQRMPTSVLLHKQADNVWRIDFQLGWDSDPEEEKRPEKVIPRIQAMLGPEAKFELEWVSVYQFACRRVDNFRYGRVIFAGDAAHQVSPFGARGANTGVQDIDNLIWKLKLVLDGAAPPALVDSYHEERAYAADDNLRNSTRSTDFITPKSAASLRMRDAVLELARSEAFARPLVNSGRLSTPTPYLSSSLNTADESEFAGRMKPGTNCADAPLQRDGQPVWLLDALAEASRGAGDFVLLVWGDGGVAAEAVNAGAVTARVLRVGPGGLQDATGVATERYDAQPGSVYLIRPDQHVAARWRSFDAAKVQAALRRCLAQ